MNQKIAFSDLDTMVTFFEYFNEIASPSTIGIIKSYTIGLPRKIIEALSSQKDVEAVTAESFNLDSSIVKFSEEQQAIAEVVNSRIAVEVEDRTGIVKISSEMPDPVAAAELTRIAKNFLISFSEEYATDKVKQNLFFVQKQYRKAKLDFYEAQSKLALFRDRNINVKSAKARTEEERLQNEYQIAYEVYLGLAQQLEQAKIKVQEQMPAFTVLKPAKIPLNKSKPKRKLLVLIFGFAGLFFTSCYYLIRSILFKD